jgi:hypothetical protein
MPPSSTCTAPRKPDGYNKAQLQQFGEVLQAWMISQIPGGEGGLDQLVCDGKHRFVAQVRLYAFCARRRSGAEGLRHP